MAITSSDIDNQSFSVERKGYSIQEVDIFLETVSKEVGILNDKVEELEKGASESSKDGATNEEVVQLNATIAKQSSEIEKLKKEVTEKINDGKAISEALIVAQRQAEKIVAEANDKAKKIIKDANDKADYIEKDADAQKKKVMQEIDKLEKEQQSCRKEYQVMLRDIITAMDKRLDESEGLSAKKSPASTNATKAVGGSTTKNAPVKSQTSPSKTSESRPVQVNPEPEKDFSGFGDTDFDDDKID